MRRIILAAGLAVLLHILLLSAKADWLKRGETKWSQPEPITLALTYHQPPKPQPRPQKRIVPPKPKTVIRKNKPPEKKVALPPPPSPQTPPFPQKPIPIPELKKVEPAEITPTPPLYIPIQESKEPVMEELEPDKEENIKTVSIPAIQSIDAYIVKDMGDEVPPVTAALPEATNPEPPPLQIAVPTHKDNPIYPRMAKKRGYEGTVVLKVLVGVDGSVVDLEILETSGHQILDREAERSVRKWLFEPWKKGDEPIEMWGQVIVRFQLN